MTRLIPLVVLCLTLAACGGAPMTPGKQPTIKLEAGTSSLHIEVAGLHSAMGTLKASLFNAAEGFPGASPIIGGARSAKANGGTLSFTFEGLPAGSYAVSVFHDENDDGIVQMNVVGKPTEGVGSTNNISHSMSAATYEESKVQVTTGQVLEATITVNY